MNKKEIIEKTAEYIEKKQSGESSGHDWWHTYRVWKLAKKIGEREEADMFIVELAALLHDVADWKFHDGDDWAGSRATEEWLKNLNVDQGEIDQVCHIVDNVSFKGAKSSKAPDSLEGKVAQDADRLDAMGAMGIARTFAYGGVVGREIYNPNLKPKEHKSFEDYKKSKGSSINHFYEKLLLLKNMMNTKSAKKMAEHRHRFMENYLKEFFSEWEGKT